MLTHLYNAGYEQVELKDIPENTIFLVITEKTCAPCYTKLEQYFKKNYQGYKVNIIVAMEDNPLLIQDKIQSVAGIYKGYDTIYFLMLNDEMRKDQSFRNLYQLATAPSPYFFTSDSHKILRHWSYAESMKLIYPGAAESAGP